MVVASFVSKFASRLGSCSKGREFFSCCSATEAPSLGLIAIDSGAVVVVEGPRGVVEWGMRPNTRALWARSARMKMRSEAASA